VTASALERLLGRELPAGEKGSVPTLNDLPHERLQEAAAVAARARLAAVEYLLFYVEYAELDHASDFVDDVLLGGADSRSWGFSNVLFVTRTSPVKALQIDVPALLQPLEAMAGERWWRVEPERKRWDWSGLCGAPGVLVRQAPYLWTNEAARLGVEGHALQDEPLEKVHDLEIAMRRWFSSRIQWELRERDARELSSISGVCRALGLPWDTLSHDGRKTIEGLVKEIALATHDERAPGFRGPDEWYAT
jgi:hypothetical protein